MSLDELRQLYEKRRSQIVEYSVHWRTATDVFPGDREKQHLDYEVRAALKGQKQFFDQRIVGVIGEPVAPGLKHTAMSYDGSETRILILRDHGRIWPRDERRQFQSPPDDFLGLQGFPTTNFVIDPSDESESVSCDIATLASSGKYHLSPAQGDADSGMMMLASDVDRLYLDPSQGHAIVKREILSNPAGGMIRQFAFNDFVEVLPELWLARTITDGAFDADKMTSLTRLSVLDWEWTDVSDSLFTLQFDPTVTIEDTRFTNSKNGEWPITIYQVPTNPDDLDAVIETAVKEGLVHEALAHRGKSARWLLLFANLAILVIGVAVYTYRRIVRNKPAKP